MTVLQALKLYNTMEKAGRKAEILLDMGDGQLWVEEMTDGYRPSDCDKGIVNLTARMRDQRHEITRYNLDVAVGDIMR